MEDWAQRPVGWTLGQPGIVTDVCDRVYLCNRSAHPLIVLEQDGTFLTSWGEGSLSSAHGMCIDAQENLYLLVINSHVVLQYSPSGNLLMTLGTWDQHSETGWSGNCSDPVKQATGPFYRPSDVAIAPTGKLYTSDGYGNARIHRFAVESTLRSALPRERARPLVTNDGDALCHPCPIVASSRLRYGVGSVGMVRTRAYPAEE